MNTGKLRSKRVIIAGVAVAAALGVGGTVMATAASADEVSGGDRDRIGNAAVQAVPGSTVIEVEQSDDQGEAYEVEVRKADGSEVSVILDKDLKVLSQEAEGPETEGADGPALTAEQRTAAETAARDAVGGGTVLDVEANAPGGTVAYEAEVRDAAGKEWDVDLDATYKVLTKTADDD
jgi:uncharacterized membrane protein YkoI